MRKNRRGEMLAGQKMRNTVEDDKLEERRRGYGRKRETRGECGGEERVERKGGKGVRMREDYEKNRKENELEERRGEKRQKDGRRGKIGEEKTIRT